MNEFAKHGITADTPSNILLGAGTWYKGLTCADGAWTNEGVLGATSGGSSIKITPEVKDIEVDGAMVLAAGLAVMQGGTVEAEVNFAEVNENILKMTMLGEKLDSASEGYVEGYDCIQTKPTISTGDYIQNLGFVGWTADGSKMIIVILEKVLCKSGFQIDPKNKENSVIKATFTGYGNIDTDLDRIPVRVYYPTVKTV